MAGQNERAPRRPATRGHGARHDSRRRPLATALALVLALLPVLPASAEPGWQPIGRAHGVAAWSAQTPTGVVRIGFRNTNDYPVAIRVQRALIWCGSEVRGEGRRIETRIGPFTLDPAQFHLDPAWRRTCREPSYFVEFRGITIERR